jgi:hypothetical protein
MLQGAAGGDGMCIDSAGRLYVTAGDTGIQVFSVDGNTLGIIPLPRSASSVAFSGPNKKVLYAKGAGMTTPDGKEYRTPDGVRNNAKAIYKVGMIAQGFTGRAEIVVDLTLPLFHRHGEALGSQLIARTSQTIDEPEHDVERGSVSNRWRRKIDVYRTCTAR